jgi:hypothetical protein
MNIYEEIVEKALIISYHYYKLFEIDSNLFFIVLINEKDFKEFDKIITEKPLKFKIVESDIKNQYQLTLLNGLCLNFFIVEIEEYIISGSLLNK